MRPAFHGTDAANHNSIVKRGLLIPGQGNELKVAHGAAHGKGVYTANVDAAWLSRGFCSAPTMLVCAVLQSDAVRHVGDAMVVSKEEHVVPMFEGAGLCYSQMLYAMLGMPWWLARRSMWCRCSREQASALGISARPLPRSLSLPKRLLQRGLLRPSMQLRQDAQREPQRRRA